MTPLEVALLEALRSALKVNELRTKYLRATALWAQKEARRRLSVEERWFNELATKAIAMADQQVSKGDAK
jgi:hypothetical protein